MTLAKTLLCMLSGWSGATPATLLAQESKPAEPGQEVSANRVVDRDYRFTLSKPPGQWKLMGESEIRQINPDAIAGFRSMTPPLGYGAIMAEPGFGTDLAAMAKVIEDNVTVDDKQVVEHEKTTLSGLDAIRVVVRGKLNGLPLRFQMVVTKRQDFVFQFVQWGMESHVRDGVLFQKMLGALKFDGGMIRMRNREKATETSYGIGWRIDAGVFQSAINGYRVSQPEGWRTVCGDELDQMNPDAEVGLTAPALNAHLVLITEPAPNNTSQLVAQVRANIRESLGSDPSRKLEFEVLGDKRAFDDYADVAAAPFSFLHGAWAENGVCYQLIAWFPPGARDRVLAQLPSVLATFEQLSPQQTTELANSLAKLPDKQNAIGTGFALRQGRFQDFRYSYVWERPRTGYWEIETGTAARQRNENARLHAAELDSGIMMMLIPEARGDISAEGYHQAILANIAVDFEDRRVEATKAATRDGIEMHSTTVRGRIGDLPFCFLVHTLVKGELALQCTFYATDGSFAAEDVVRDAVNGIDLRSDMPPTHSTATRHQDRRLGFRLEGLPRGCRVQDVTPSELRALGTVLEVEGAPAKMMVLAVYAPMMTPSEAWFAKLMQDSMRRSLGVTTSVEPNQGTGELAGQSCRRLIWNGLLQDSEGLVLLRERTFYGLFLQGSDAERQSTKALFSLME